MHPTRRDDLLWEAVAEEIVVWDKIQNRAHRLNRSASIVWRNANGNNSLQDLTVIVSRELGPIESPSSIVEEAVDRLNALGLLNAGKEQTGSRRELIRRAAMVAAAVPVIASIAVPTAARAASLIDRGDISTNF
jgi:hypothetical protein